jgi:hypothetical protein
MFSRGGRRKSNFNMFSNISQVVANNLTPKPVVVEQNQVAESEVVAEPEVVSEPEPEQPKRKSKSRLNTDNPIDIPDATNGEP